MKLYIHEKSVIGRALEAVTSLGKNSEVVVLAEEADEVLCISSNDALDLLLSDHKVILVQIGRGDQVAVDALEKNERFKDSLHILRFTSGEGDGQAMVDFINHCAQ